MTMVLDASLTMSWYFDDESTATTGGLLDRVADAGALAPTVCGSRWPTRSRWRSLGADAP